MPQPTGPHTPTKLPWATLKLMPSSVGGRAASLAAASAALRCASAANSRRALRCNTPGLRGAVLALSPPAAAPLPPPRPPPLPPLSLITSGQRNAPLENSIAGAPRAAPRREVKWPS